MKTISEFASSWYSVVQGAIIDPETSFFTQNISDTVHGLLSRVQDTLGSSSLTSLQRMVLNSLQNDLNNLSSCIQSKVVDCPIDDYFEDIEQLSVAFSQWDDGYRNFHRNLWDVYTSSFALELYGIWKSWNDDNNRDDMLDPDTLEAVNFLQNALSGDMGLKQISDVGGLGLVKMKKFGM